jgi:hypothetical protein
MADTHTLDPALAANLTELFERVGDESDLARFRTAAERRFTERPAAVQRDFGLDPTIDRRVYLTGMGEGVDLMSYARAEELIALQFRGDEPTCRSASCSGLRRTASSPVFICRQSPPASSAMTSSTTTAASAA